MTNRVYGTIALDVDGRWRIAAEPHVLVRLKRLFGRVEKTAGGITIYDGDDVAKDLAWVLERYPMTVSGADLKHMQRRAKVFDDRAYVFNGILTGDIEPRSFEMALPPRDYQRAAADLALRNHGLLVADELGLGKTATAICVLTEPVTRPALVVTLTHLPTQWQREIAKFAPSLRTHVVRTGKPYDIAKKREMKGHVPDVIIMNYHKLSGWADVLAGKVRTVVFDEVQELRRDESAKAAAAKQIAEKAEYRIGLSATPIYNLGSEFFSVFSVLRPDVLGSHQEFMREWCTGTEHNGQYRIKDPKAFGSFVREAGLMVRRTRVDVRRELPPLTRMPHYVDADTESLDKATTSVEALAKFILDRDGSTFERMRAGGELDWRMRQATGIAKAPYVAEFVRLIVESGEKVILYGWHHAVYDVWAERLKEFRVAYYTGEETPSEKEKSRTSFLDPEGAQVLIMSLRAGAGLDGLQEVCRTVVFGELDWSPGVHEQCTGRVFRDGQKDPVMAYFLVSDEGSDPVVADVLGLKKAQIEGVRDPDAALVEAMEAPEHGIRRLAEAVMQRAKSR